MPSRFSRGSTPSLLLIREHSWPLFSMRLLAAVARYLRRLKYGRCSRILLDKEGANHLEAADVNIRVVCADISACRTWMAGVGVGVGASAVAPSLALAASIAVAAPPDWHSSSVSDSSGSDSWCVAGAGIVNASV